MYDAVLSETVTITGHEGDAIEAYSARPLTPGPVGGVVVIHHLPGYDRADQGVRPQVRGGRVRRRSARTCTRREAPGADPDDAMAAAARAQGGIPDEQLVGDVAEAAAYLRGSDTPTARSA